MPRRTLADEIGGVTALCGDLGLGGVAPVLLKAAHHTTLRLAPLPLVARVQSAEPPDEASARAVREIAVTRHLIGRGAPVVAPLDGMLAGPHLIGGNVITLWPLVEHRAATDDDAGIAATSLAAVHDGLRDFTGDLPPYTLGLDRCRQALDDGRVSAALNDDERALLQRQLDRLRGEIAATTTPWQPLHGDAHPGNLLLVRDGPLWTDFEDACRGPREKDIACLPATVWRTFPGADQGLIARFADLTSVCVAIWCSADLARSAEIQEAAEHHLARVRAMAG